MVSSRRTTINLIVIIVVCLMGRFSPAVELVSLKRKGKARHIEGRILIEAQDGGLLMQSPNGRIWTIQPKEIVSRKKNSKPFKPLTKKQLTQQLKDELPGYRFHTTTHYVICYNTSPAYAKWCGGLYERLYRGFYRYWKTNGMRLKQPEFPLVGLVFQDHKSFAGFGKKELGTDTGTTIGYYNLKTNRVNMYDLTGVEGLNANLKGRVRNSVRINQILSQPAAERTVATIVHEATHQLAYNSGLQTRLAGNPLWVSEGLAVFFETPDLSSGRGWRKIGAVNRFNMFQFRRSLSRRDPGSLAELIRADKRFQNPQTTADAYSEAWALNYFLLRTKKKKYVKYLQQLSKLDPLQELSAEERLTQFKAIFGEDLERLDSQFLRYIRRVR